MLFVLLPIKTVFLPSVVEWIPTKTQPKIMTVLCLSTSSGQILVALAYVFQEEHILQSSLYHTLPCFCGTVNFMLWFH